MSAVALGAWRTRYELLQYVRSGDTVVFTFLFPIVLLALFSAIFGADGEYAPAPGLPPVPVAQMYLPAMLAGGMLLSGFQNLAMDIANERTNGMLKRLGATPLSPLSYFVGKIGQVGTTSVIQAALLIVFATVVYGVPLPTEPGKWLTFAWVFVLGVVASSLLGVALSAVPRSGRSASAVIIPIVLVVQFISGVYLFFFLLPDWLQTIAAVLPVKWMAQGMREIFLPPEYAVLEQHQEWNLAGVAIALTIWAVIGLLTARVTFRWSRRDA
ncbi:ABC transporter permease [Microbacterium xanthum]|uniref:ABC transporter permease n=1 Tax=Microbacterium xanthum TaxID=3079794 RepID=UPI002AD5AC6B|nr:MULTISPECIES: ABC transporter permease [unclassified Microbacterium]MDZ8171797.1 ABC transporter permease [Microbacterium sp. KSW-48]MDZ8200100.1 ABC transporter permease [Microbacterium sp. SSW1-59]